MKILHQLNSLLRRAFFKDTNNFFEVGAPCWLTSTNLQIEFTLVVGDVNGGLQNEREHGLETLSACLADLVEPEHFFLVGQVFFVLSDPVVSD